MTDMTDTKQFSLGAVLTVTTGRLLCPIDDLYQILNYLVGADLFTHQLPRAGEAAQEPLLEQLPQLREVEVPADFHGGKEKVQAWLATQEEIYGTHLPVTPLAPGLYQHKDMLSELAEMVDPAQDHPGGAAG